MKKTQLSPAILTVMIIVGAPLICIAILFGIAVGLWMPWGALIAVVLIAYLMLYTLIKLSMR